MSAAPGRAQASAHRSPKAGGTPASVLLQISDTHFGTEQPAVMHALHALALQLQPDLIVLSGDITQRARPDQFRAAKTFVDRLGASVLAIPGNHDIALFNLWARITRPYARYAAVFGTDLEPVYSAHDLLVVGVNTTRAWRHKNGEVSAAQIDRVAHLLRAASPQQLRVVVVHQPVAVIREDDEPNLLRGHATAMPVWSAAGADVVMGGHIHLPYTLAVQGLARNTWVVQAGTAVSSRVRSGAPNSVNVLRWSVQPKENETQIDINRDAQYHCLVEQWDYVAAEKAFVFAQANALAPDRP